MSRNDFTSEQRTMLDRFDAPPLRDGFANRVMVAEKTPTPRVDARDRRGRWTLARRAIIGTVAAGMVSAAAVASGLLGAAGIRVPVLTAMLAPEPVPVSVPTRVAAKPTPKKSPPASRPLSAPIAPLSDDEATASVAQREFTEARARRATRRAERQAFIREHPEVVPVIKQAIKNERAFAAANPEIRALRRLPLSERKAYLAQNPELDAAMRTRQAERRAFRKANPEVEAIIRARIEERRAARRAGQIDAPGEGNVGLPR